MTITLEEVKKHMKTYKNDYSEILASLNGLVMESRDAGAPIYLTNHRVKKVADIYLKTKRKGYKKVTDNKDFAGMRILCLFEDDVFIVHRHLVEILSKNGYELDECKIYNFNPKSRKIQQAIETTKSVFSTITPVLEDKESGYKSMHYLVTTKHNKRDCYVEIQLRTLFQDVWGELEHTLSYKRGNIHPHIKKSFQLLSNDIANSDMLISHLRTINDREIITDNYDNDKIASMRCYHYEEERLPEIFLSGKSKTAYGKYAAHVEQLCGGLPAQDYIPKATVLYEAIKATLRVPQMSDPKIKYWCKMEEAYLCYCSKQYEVAADIYKRLEKEFPDSYVIPFRLGEIHLITSNGTEDTVSGLSCFDKCEQLLKAQNGKAKQLNSFQIKSRLALFYWSLGSEFFDLAIEKISEAKTIYDKHKDTLPDAFGLPLLNNICYYNLEKVIVLAEKEHYCLTEKSNQYYNKAKEQFLALRPTLETDDVNSNTLDTSAWFCYYAAKCGDNDENYMELAQKYCLKAVRMKRFGQITFRSLNTHMNHFQLIMGEAVGGSSPVAAASS